jgi:hypothetical protein
VVAIIDVSLLCFEALFAFADAEFASFGVFQAVGRAASFRPKRRSRSEFVTTVTDESAIAAAAKIGALSRRNGMAGEAIASGISTLL